MPVTIKTANIKYKNSDGEYVGINAVAETKTEEQIAAIQSAGTQAITDINTRKAQIDNILPSDYTELNNRIDNIIDQLENIEIDYNFLLTYTQGSLDIPANNGVEIASTTRLRTEYFKHKSNNPIEIIIPSDLEIAYRYYTLSNNEYTCIGSINFTDNSPLRINKTGEYYYRLIVRYTNSSSTIYPDAANNIIATEITYTDDTLSLDEKAANAKTTGEALKLAFSYKESITVDTDLNDLKEIGLFLLFSGHNYTNVPNFYTSGSAWIINFINKNNNFLIQLFYKTGIKKWAIRELNQNVWSDWTIYDDEYSVLYGKKLSILGDSISTYQGYNPDGYSYYYPSGNIDNVNKTWWKLIADNSGLTILANASWSGSSVCDDDNLINSAKVAYSDARIADLSVNNNNPDIIIIMIGTNDFKHANALGTLTDSDIPPLGTTSIHTFKEAYACMINKIHIAYPNAHIYCCTLIPRYDSSTGSTYPIKNSDGISIYQYNKAITDIAEWMNCNLIRLDNIFSLQKVYDYTVDHALHPNYAGAKIISNRILKYLINGERTYIK